ncbi:MAG TPA: WbuC family cupin fold metalloprotein [Oligoflexus sp.]|uniref:WbuC family cupin fold metalloprotein n=1 Tax=Oligoflexus sp. TaxID=1971216 RepID=UPI002D46C916|nr:WbuC family cupin fold metalloprotein [Oligoflexus sp.]HYX38382.1 WbuC family cupin fold metalloprotein [Oligoflexus sp.]
MTEHNEDSSLAGRRVQTVDQTLLNQVSSQAQSSPRKRMNHNLHQLEDRVQRMLNALEPATYVRPHRHLDPPKFETFVILRGKTAVLIFSDEGRIENCIILSPNQTCIVDIPPGTWHSLVALEPGTVLIEAKDGPYIASTDKDFAAWAPRENSRDAAVWLEEVTHWILRHLSSQQGLPDENISARFHF